MQVVFKRGCGRGRNRPRSLHDRLERALIRLAVLQPADAAVADAQDDVLVQLEHALTAVDRQSANIAESSTVEETGKSCESQKTAVTEMFFRDAEARPGYRPRPPKSRREELEQERQRLRTMLWSGDASDAELKAEIERIEAELRALEGKP
jgi:hypothetical protein